MGFVTETIRSMPESGGLTKCHSAFPLRGSIGAEFSRCGSGCEFSARLFLWIGCL